MTEESNTNICFSFAYLQNQTSNRTISHLNSSASIVIGSPSMPALTNQFSNNNNNNTNINNTNNNSTTNNNNINNVNTTNINNNNNHNFNNSSYIISTQQQSGNISPNNNQQLQTTMLQQQISAAAAVIAQHQQQQQKMLLHSALTRAVSHPQGGNVASLVNSIIENFGHRKLERTQSEPLPQVNASRFVYFFYF